MKTQEEIKEKLNQIYFMLANVIDVDTLKKIEIEKTVLEWVLGKEC